MTPGRGGPGAGEGRPVMGLFSSSNVQQHNDAKQAKWEAKRAKDMDRMIKAQKNMKAREMAKVRARRGK